MSQTYTKTELMLFNGVTVSESYLEMQKEKQAMIPAERIFVGYFEQQCKAKQGFSIFEDF